MVDVRSEGNAEQFRDVGPKSDHLHNLWVGVILQKEIIKLHQRVPDEYRKAPLHEKIQLFQLLVGKYLHYNYI